MGFEIAQLLRKFTENERHAVACTHVVLLQKTRLIPCAALLIESVLRPSYRHVRATSILALCSPPGTHLAVF
jgi:hypothetical protein